MTNGEALPLSRRRALAISEDDRPSDFLYRAPLPGVDPDAPAPFAAAPIVSAVPDDEPLELSELAQEDEENDPDGELEMSDAPETRSAWPSHQHYPRGHEPLPFAAPSLARHAPEPELESEPELEPELDSEPEPQLEAIEAEDTAEARGDWQTAPLDGLGLVQLVQRLGATIERRREWIASAAEHTPAAPFPPFAEAGLEPAAPEDAVQAMAEFFGAAAELEPAPEPDPEAAVEPAPARRPEFLRPLPIVDEDDSEDAIPDFSLPLRRSADAADNEATDIDNEDGFTSLLAMKNPFAAPRSEFVRVEEPEEDAALAEPTVAFPGQGETHVGRLFDPPGKTGSPAATAPQVPADADAALRAALATLQRMSGAA